MRGERLDVSTKNGYISLIQSYDSFTEDKVICSDHLNIQTSRIQNIMQKEKKTTWTPEQ